MSMTILVPLDGSPLAERALPFASRLAKATNGQLVLYHASYVLRPNEPPPIEIEAVAARLQGTELQVEAYQEPLYHEDMARAIVEAAERKQAALIVMSTHGRGGLGRVIFGSVADRVLRQSGVPVLLVPATRERPWVSEGPLRVLVALDGSPRAEAVLNPALKLVELLQAEVVLAQVVHHFTAEYDTFNADRELARARQYLEERAATLPVKVDTVALYSTELDGVGAPAGTLAAYARDQGIDLIAMATHGRSGLARLVLGSVATRTLELSHAPLLLVRPGKLHEEPAEGVAGSTGVPPVMDVPGD